MNSFRNKIKNNISEKKSSFVKDVTWREKNKYWLSNSQMVAISILSEMDKKGIEPLELALKLKVTPQRVSKILKGLENFTFKTVGDIEEALNISLMHIYIGEKVSVGASIEVEHNIVHANVNDESPVYKINNMPIEEIISKTIPAEQEAKILHLTPDYLDNYKGYSNVSMK
jgi:transcriptional regulator with XRE-family HTH domain